jgi:hypothetical protein
MSESIETKSVYGETGKEKGSACRRDNDEIAFAPHKKPGERFQFAYMKSSSSRSNDAARPPLMSAVRVQKVEIINELEPAGHDDDDHGSVDEYEQVAGHSSVDNGNDGDSEKCPVCLENFTTQVVGIPDICDHTFCASCLHEWSKNENNCPVDRQKFNFILVRRHVGGKIIKRIPVKTSRQKIEWDPEDSDSECRRRRLIWIGILLSFLICMLLVCVAAYDKYWGSKSHPEDSIARTHRIGRPTPITVPHSKMAGITFSRDGKIGSPRINTENSSLRNRAVHVDETDSYINVLMLWPET